MCSSDLFDYLLQLSAELDEMDEGLKTEESSLSPDPATPVREVRGMRYYTNAVHRAAFVLPPFLEDLIREN